MRKKWSRPTTKTHLQHGCVGLSQTHLQHGCAKKRALEY